jgi:hypothetical protein
MRGHDLTGFWSGEYRYRLPGERPVPFLAALEEAAGAVTGIITEPNSVGDTTPELRALVDGVRQGTAVRFAKTYDGESDLAHRVDYAGTLSEDGLTLAGEWSVAGMTGAFSMTRGELPGESLAVMQAEDAELEQVR